MNAVLRIKKKSFASFLGQTINPFGNADNYIESFDQESLADRVFRNRKRPSQQPFSESLGESFQAVGEAIRASIIDFKKKTR